MERKQIIDFYSRYSAQFDVKIGSLDLYNQSYVDFIQMASQTRNLLDLACGPGNVSRFILNLLPEIQVTCVDLSKQMLELAKAKLKSGEFYQSDILEVNIPEISYDLIVCAFGLPYIRKEEIGRFVQQIDKFAHHESIIYVSCMQGENSLVEEMSFANGEKLIVYYHCKENIINEFRVWGFKLLDYKEQDYPEQNGTTTTDMIFIFKRK